MALAILGSLLVALSSDFLFLAEPDSDRGGGMAIAVIIPPALSKGFKPASWGSLWGF